MTIDCIGYVRVSTEQQAGEDKTSLAEQRRAITERAQRLGRVLLASSVFDDPGVSGATAEGRPGFMRMLAHCEANPRSRSALGLVLVLNDSRFGRFDDPEEATHWRFVLKKLGWIVRFAEGDDVEDGIARGVLRYIGQAQSSEYRANLKRTARRSARVTALEGRWQTRAPLGYRRLATRHDGAQRVLEDAQRKSSDEVVRLTLGPASEHELVAFIFDEYASGRRTLGRLATYLHETYPGRHWSPGTVQALLKNPAYLGDLVWCRRPHDETERREQRVRDRTEWVVVPDAHPAIVSRETFALVAARLATNRVERRATSGGYPLSGFITCAHCQSPFVGGGGRRGPDDDPDRYRFYVDKGGIARQWNAAPICTGTTSTIRKRWIEQRVVQEIARVLEHRGVQRVIAEEMDRALEEALGSSVDRRAQLEEDQAEIARRRARIVSAIGAGTLTEREATSTLAELRAKASAMEAEIERTRFAERRSAGMAAVRDRMLTIAADFATQAMRCSGPALRELVRPWLAAATLNKHTRMLTLKIWTVPDLLGMDSSDALQRAGGNRNSRLIVTRRIAVPDSPSWAARRRAAGR